MVIAEVALTNGNSGRLSPVHHMFCTRYFSAADSHQHRRVTQASRCFGLRTLSTEPHRTGRLYPVASDETLLKFTLRGGLTVKECTVLHSGSLFSLARFTPQLPCTTHMLHWFENRTHRGQ